METENNRWTLAQPSVGIVTSASAIALVAFAWLTTRVAMDSTATGWTDGALALALIAAMYLAYQFPIHIRYTIKMEMSSVPLYLTAVLLPPSVAALTAGLGLVVSELSMQQQRATYLSDIATAAGRWMAIVLGGSLLIHLAPPGYSASYLLALVAAAGVLLASDILTAPLGIVPITGERYLHVLKDCACGVGLPEAGQYFFACIGAMLAVGNVWYPCLLFLPVTLVYRIAKRAKEMHESTRLFLEHMADQVDSKDPFTREHSKRVTAWTQAMLRELNVVGPEAMLIVTAARVHDIGKLSLPDTILHKHEKLTAEEWALMEQHPALGADLLARYPTFARGAAIVRGHHERFDGAGYPDKIAGTDIPFGARVIAVADSFDAMTSDRPYRRGMPVERAAAILQGGRGTQWDPAIVDVFLQLLADQLEQPAAAPGRRASAPALTTSVS